MLSPEELISETKLMLFLARADGEPSPKFRGHPGTAEFYFRVLERQMELVGAIERLLKEGLIQASFALLRVVLENAAMLTWVAKDPAANLPKFQDAEKPKAIPRLKVIMDDIGWAAEYNEIYSNWLSLFVHPRPTGLDLYKMEIPAIEGFSPLPLVDTYGRQMEDGNFEIFHIVDTPAGMLINDHGPFIALKMYDIAVSSLTLCHDEYPESFCWWPRRTILRFDSFATSDAAPPSTLWRSIRPTLATVRAEGKIYGDPAPQFGGQ